MSIFSSSKTSQMFFNIYIRKLRSQVSAYNKIITVLIQVAFLTDFHEIHVVGEGPYTVETYRFWRQSTSRTIDIGENVPQTQFFGFHSVVWAFLKKNFQNCICTPFPQKLLYSFLSQHAPVILENIVFFEKKLF